MRTFRKLTIALLGMALIVVGALGLAQAEEVKTPVQNKTSRGVIVLPGTRASTLAYLEPGDTPMLAGQKVTVELLDTRVGLPVSSTTLPDLDLARVFVEGGLAAEVNYLRQVLPITPTAELFNMPQGTRPEDLPFKPDFWHVEQIGADIVHSAGITGDSAVIVGVIDTGVDHNHPWFADVLLPGFDFVDGDGEVEDSVGHGTHVAGIIHSICPRCSILPVKVLDYSGGDDYTIARGIRYASQQGAKVIQISLGGPAPSTTLCQAIRAVEEQGAAVVIAAGNAAGSDAQSIGYPALCSPASFVVSAADRYDIPAWFSNYGPAIDLAAPGRRVWSAIPRSSDYEDLVMPASGTSMAAPQVSGAAALLWSGNPAWTAPQIAARLIATARNISVLPGIDDGYGPRLDVAQAFGLLSRPVVVGMVSTRPWVPRSGSAQERTVQVRAHIRGEAVTAVQLMVTINDATEHMPMTIQGDGTYGVDYTVPENPAYLRDIFLQVVAENNAGSMYGDQEVAIQDGDPIPPATIQILNGPAYVGRPVRLSVSWLGSWNNFSIYCDNFSSSYYINLSKDQIVTCKYPWNGVFTAGAVLYYQDRRITVTEVQIEVLPPPPIYLPLVIRR